MITILIVILVVMLLGGFGGNRFGYYNTAPSLLWLILAIILILAVFNWYPRR
jgi:hypothetical protein